jgi:asparagine synthase (glutamine-hydrolysing)
MADTLDHQESDDQECWLSPRAALAYRRLRMIDLQDGKHPMVYQVGNRTYAITFKGISGINGVILSVRNPIS